MSTNDWYGKWKKTADELAVVRAQRDELAGAIRQTLNENGHLADGDVCTLKVLKDALAKLESAK